MKRFIYILVFLGTILPSSALFAQKNRISLQSGLFHSFLDGTPLFNKEQVTDYHNLETPLYCFSGHFNDSWGLQYQRSINPKSRVSCEFMVYNATYQRVFPIRPKGPSLTSRRLNEINITYSRNTKIGDKWQFNYGVGVSTQWGVENWFLADVNYPGLGCYLKPNSQFYFRNDLGVNLRSGIEYSPFSQLTLFSYIDFQGTLFLSYPSEGYEELYPYFFAEHGNEIKASRLNLSLNFGIGFNF